MKIRGSVLIAALILLLAACKKNIHNFPQPSPTPEEGYTGVGSSANDPPLLQNSLPENSEVSTPASINMDMEDKENRLVKQEVLKRIDVMPNLTDEEKDKLYVQVERARAMGKVVTIPFASGERLLQSSAIDSLLNALKLPQIETFSHDPTVVFVVLGYADKKGDQKTNIAISTQRADAIVKILKEKAGLMNVIHAVGMGSSEMFDSANLDKNRVAEVWAVLP